VTKGSDGNPIFGRARGLQLDFSYDMPPAAAQQSDRTLDTLHAQMTQAVQAFRPLRGRHSFWTQHTIKSPIDPAFSVVQVYEIDPITIGTPELLDSTILIFGSSASIFNAAVSPDRQASGTTENFGDNWVLGYNVSGPTDFPTVYAGSSVLDGPFQHTILVQSAGPYTDTVSCPNPGDTCRWGDYSGASPDPNPAGLGVSGSGVVWGTNQFSSGAPPPPPPATSFFVNWLTQIFALQP
jgi:hypothetical protein